MNYRWEKDYRYYEAHLEHDLYGWVIIRTWGRKQTRKKHAGIVKRTIIID